ncbi:DUF6236 family protein [Bacillus sp. 03113]|uniref:DUF6236 family protein n=1 Tax=Bacillus sp. 03113 TaxID=2578211 RepID=UPI0011439024|nr:DUF6236 family protein [Bacillus sp. 03113]
MRGIVISPIKITGKNSMTINGIDPIKLRQYLLYWDKIDFPQNNIIGFGDSPDIEYLKNVGVLKQTRVQIQLSGEMTELYLKGQLMALRMNNEVEKGCWSLGQENIDLVLPRSETVLDRGIEFNLYNGLPVPSSDVSFEDIMHFKEKRNDELLEFRFLMDNFYQELLKSGDSERAMLTYIENIYRKIISIDKVMNESKIKRFRGSVKIRFDLGEAIRNTFFGAIGAAGAGTILNVPITAGLGATMGFASSFIKINSEMSLKPKGIPTELKDYAYLYYADKELK